MKTRIISGIVMGAVVAAFLALGLCVNENFINLFVAVISALGTYELLHNAMGIKSKSCLTGATIYGFVSCLFYAGVFPAEFIAISAAYMVYITIVCIYKHDVFDISKILACSVAPIVLSLSLGCLGSVLKYGNGLYYLLLLLNFASVCDIGAYFTGVTIGKHKLCPQISPKKTVEGAIGGIVLSLIVTIILCLGFKMTENFIWTVILTVPLCIVGMFGDLFASLIKRAVGIKDYGNLIPGHGGILDRLDSILFIAPAVFSLMTLGVL